MKRFLDKYTDWISGSLSGFDRLVLRGTLRMLAVKNGMMEYLFRMQVLLKDFGEHVEKTSQAIKAATVSQAQRLGRPVQYLQSAQQSKEEIALRIAKQEGISQGLICVLSCVEPCMSYEIRRDKEQRKLVLQPAVRKCLHYYHYWYDPQFGFMNGRIATWFPFGIQICLNGREWLSRQMDKAGLGYQRADNCFVSLDQPQRVQRLMDKQLRINWPAHLQRIARQLNPAHEHIFQDFPIQYYWSVYQSEWATDVMFDSTRSLDAIYPMLTRGAITAFCSADVLRFLGQRVRTGFSGEVCSSYLQRPEGVRIKHAVQDNSVKCYNKQGSVLRVETTINNPRQYKVYRPKENSATGARAWYPMRKGIADMHRRAAVSQASNQRYLDALASLSTATPLEELLRPLCQPTNWHGKRIRGLRPWADADIALLRTIANAKWLINGFRNHDLLVSLFPGDHDNATRKRLAARVTRTIRMLRAHGLIRKSPHTHRYSVNTKAREVLNAVLQVQTVTTQQLQQIAA